MKKTKIGVIGLGYVGLPVAICFAKKYNVVGYDISQSRVDDLNNFKDLTNEISSKDLRKNLSSKLKITSSLKEVEDCNVYIITVPTPIDKNKAPDLSLLLQATEAIGRILKINDIVIYESTVYPGCTEDECAKLLEKVSGLKYNKEFYCGYSPERINPGDKEHTIEKIVKITSGSNLKTAEKVDKLYSSVITAGTYMAKSIKIAEAAKVIENSQRDINIAFVNELSIIFNKLNIDTNAVLNAASTKWNFLDFRPGLVGGHCIGVDPYYLADKAISLGLDPRIILAGREMNDSMGIFVADQIINLLEKNQILIKNSSVLILGATFKENCPDFRNTKVVDIAYKLIKKGLKVDIYDPWINNTLFQKEYNLNLIDSLKEKKYNAIVLAVGHDEFQEIEISKLKLNNKSIIYDVKGFLDENISNKRL